MGKPQAPGGHPQSSEMLPPLRSHTHCVLVSLLSFQSLSFYLCARSALALHGAFFEGRIFILCL